MTGKLQVKEMGPHQIPANTLIISPKGMLYLISKLNSQVIIICVFSTLENQVFTVFLSSMPVTQCRLLHRLQLRTSLSIKTTIKLKVCDFVSIYLEIFQRSLLSITNLIAHGQKTYFFPAGELPTYHREKKKHTLYDLNAFEVIGTCFMAPNIGYLGECSMSI